jgi:cell division protein ZapA
MNRGAVELKVGGQTYRVVTSAAEDELQRLAGVVDARLRDLTAPGRGISPQTLLLAAISLAHDLEIERERSSQIEQRSREMLSTVLERIDAALDTVGDEPPDPHAESPEL